jgi:disease resistance protein RPM1
MFPEDHMIPRYDLVLTWVAEGFVDEKQGSNLYDIAKWYFNELVNRSIIQPVNKDENGNAKYCRVHDMILDLIISLSVQENFVTISEGSHLIAPACKIRRLSLQGTKVYCNKEATTEEQAILPSTVNVSQVRSLIASGDTCKCLPPLSRFAILRVLSLTCFPGKRNHVKDLGSLLHLRYLKLGGKLEVELLKELGNLQHLKALDLFSADIEELPASIIRLRQLECLIIPRTVKVPNGIENLMSLELLRWLNVEKSLGTLVGLGNLIKLQGLGISGLHSSESCAETFLQGLSNLGNLRRLSFRGHGICSLNCMPDQWQGPSHLQRFRSNDLTFCQVPRWFSSLSELSNVSIRVNLLRQRDLELLGALPALCFLKLQVDPYGTTDERLVVGADQPFRCLTAFMFHHYSRCWLVFAQGVMPKLQRLELSFEVRKREDGGFDTGLENLLSLKHVAFKVDCTGARIREVQDAETKIRNVVGIHPSHPVLKLSRKHENLKRKE